MKASIRRPKKLRASPVPQPHSWETIAVGAIVLASAGPRHFEWHEAVVLSVEGETFELRYCEWPDEPIFTRSREQLALLHHSQRPPPPLEPTKVEAKSAARAVKANACEHLSDEDLQPASAA